MSRPECSVTLLTGIGKTLQMSLHVVPHMRKISISNFPTVSTRIDPILSSDDVLVYLLINLLGVGDGRIIGDHYGLRELSGFSNHMFLLDCLRLSERVVLNVNDCLL